MKKDKLTLTAQKNNDGVCVSHICIDEMIDLNDDMQVADCMVKFWKAFSDKDVECFLLEALRRELKL